MVSKYVIDGGTVPTVLDVHFDVTNIIILALNVATQLAVNRIALMLRYCDRAISCQASAWRARSGLVGQ